MSATSTTTTKNAPQPSRRGRGHRSQPGNKGGSRARGSTKSSLEQTHQAPNVEKQEGKKQEEISTKVLEASEDGDLCWICAEPVKYYSVSQCNHRTCHVCALRLRALYQKTDCTFCKDPQPSVIFTASPDAPFSSFSPDEMPHKDTKLSIYFETQEMMEETLILLRFNCPDPDCDHIAAGWGDLRLHVRALHGKMMCELCIRSKKVFSHEHALYPPSQLPLHLPSMPHRSYKNQPKEQIEGGVHPLCEFCHECFFSDDELYTHMRERHEECFICKRNEIRDKYFQNYASLENHFNHEHYPCPQPQCQARKFVVFNTLLDLKAHTVEEHGSEMTSRDIKAARQLQAEFEFEEIGSGGRRGRRDRGEREREREPPPAAPGSARPGGRRREGFGASLTVEGGTSSNNEMPEPSRRPTPSPPRDVDLVLAQRHAAFLARLQAMTPNSPNAVSAVKIAIRGYRASETTARDLISTVWNIVDRDIDDTASIVNALVDILDDEEKKTDLLSSWNGFKIEQRRQFPDLVPSSVGSGYAGITSGRVLNVKHSAASRSSYQSSRQVWDRVAQAASSSSSSLLPPAPRPARRFPPLHPTAAPPQPTTTPFRQPQRNTPWAGSTASSNTRGPSSVPGPGAKMKSTPAPAQLSKSQFPDLPTSGAVRHKPPIGGNQSLKKIRGETTPPAPVWGTNGNGNTPSESPGNGDAGAEGSHGKGKKGKWKQKQTLFTLGAFPT